MEYKPINQSLKCKHHSTFPNTSTEETCMSNISDPVSWLQRSQAWVKMSPAQGHKLFIIFSLALKGIVADNA